MTTCSTIECEEATVYRDLFVSKLAAIPLAEPSRLEGIFDSVAKVLSRNRYHDLKHSYRIYKSFMGSSPLGAISSPVEASVLLASLYHDLTTSIPWTIGKLTKDFGSHSSVGPVLDRSIRMIRATNHLDPNRELIEGELNKKFASADLEILGSAPQEYESYRSNVQMEYNLPEDKWATGRRAVVEVLLEREPLFPDSVYESKLGDIARENLRQELSTLSQGEGL